MLQVEENKPLRLLNAQQLRSLVSYGGILHACGAKITSDFFSFSSKNEKLYILQFEKTNLLEKN